MLVSISAVTRQMANCEWAPQQASGVLMGSLSDGNLKRSISTYIIYVSVDGPSWRFSTFGSNVVNERQTRMVRTFFPRRADLIR